MNHTRSLWGLRPFSNRPLPNLIRPRCEETSQLQTLPHCQNNLRQRTLRAQLLALLSGIRLRLIGRKTFLEGDANGDYWVAGGVLFDPFGDLREVLVFLTDVVFLREVDQVDDGFCGEEEQGIYDFDLSKWRIHD